MKQITLTLITLVVSVVMSISSCSKAYAAVLSQKPENNLELSEVYTDSEYKYVIGYRGTNRSYYISYLKEKPKVIEDKEVGYMLQGNGRSFRLMSNESLTEAAKQERDIEEGTAVGITVQREDIAFLNFSIYDGKHFIPKHGINGYTLFGMSTEEVTQETIGEAVGVLPILLGVMVLIFGIERALREVKRSLHT